MYGDDAGQLWKNVFVSTSFAIFRMDIPVCIQPANKLSLLFFLFHITGQINQNVIYQWLYLKICISSGNLSVAPQATQGLLSVNTYKQRMLSVCCWPALNTSVCYETANTCKKRNMICYRLKPKGEDIPLHEIWLQIRLWYSVSKRSLWTVTLFVFLVIVPSVRVSFSHSFPWKHLVMI